MRELSSVIIERDRIDADRSSIVLVVEGNEVAALQMSTELEELVPASPPVAVIHTSPERLRLDRGIVQQLDQIDSRIRPLFGQSHQCTGVRDRDQSMDRPPVKKKVMTPDSWWAQSEIDA